MMWLPVLLLCIAGFLALAAAMNRHQRQLGITRITPITRHLWQVAGAGLQTLALLLCMWRAGWAVGMVLWFGYLTVAGVMTALLFTCRSRND